MREQVQLHKLADLRGSLQQEAQLSRQRVALAVAIKALQKGVGIGLLQDQLRPEMAPKPLSERRLAGSDRTLDDDMAQLRSVAHMAMIAGPKRGPGLLLAL